MPEYWVTSRVNYTYKRLLPANSPEEAATWAHKADLREAGEARICRARVEAVEEDTEQDGEGQCWEVISICDYCDSAITDREIPNQPWNYKYDLEHGVYICYGCMNGVKK